MRTRWWRKPTGWRPGSGKSSGLGATAGWSPGPSSRQRRAKVPQKHDRKIRSDSRPLYLQVVRAIEELAEEEGLQPGSALPSEPRLAQMFDVGRTTIREALVYLENERLIERSQGARTTLTPLFHQPVIGLEVLEPLELLAARQGWSCGTRDIRIEASEATDEEARRLRVAHRLGCFAHLADQDPRWQAAGVDAQRRPRERRPLRRTAGRVQGLDHAADPSLEPPAGMPRPKSPRSRARLSSQPRSPCAGVIRSWCWRSCSSPTTASPSHGTRTTWFREGSGSSSCGRRPGGSRLEVEANLSDM